MGAAIAKHGKPPRFDQKTIGARMRQAREMKALSRNKLIKKAGGGISEDSLRKKEKGITPFYFRELDKLCDALDAPTLFPFMDWGEAHLADKLLGRVKD